jgi:hypothetical protein
VIMEFDFTARTSNASLLSRCKRALPQGGQLLRHTELDSTMDQMRVKATFAVIHVLEGHHQQFSLPSVVTTRQTFTA